jgi:hypothetical protein
MALSPGCTDAHNIGVYAGLQARIGPFEGQFAAGERLTASVGPPSGGPFAGDFVKLFVEPAGDPCVACVAYPGTVGYTFLDNGNYRWQAGVFGVYATWTIDCGLAPPFNSAQEITALKAKVAGLPVASSVKDPLIHDLDRALEALGRAVIAPGSRPINRGLALFRRSSTVARFLDWAWADPCSSLQTFIARARLAYGVNQITEVQWCELEYTATGIRRMLNC